MRGLLPPKGGHPLALHDAGLVNAHLVRERGLERALPVVLERLHTQLGAATGVAQPAKVFGKKRLNAVDGVVIQAVHHALHHTTGGLGLGQVVVARERGLFGAGPFHAGPSSAGTGWYQGTSARWP